MRCCTGVHSDGNVGLQSEMYQLSSSPDEFVIKQRGRRHSLQSLCLSLADYSDSGMWNLLLQLEGVAIRPVDLLFGWFV